MDGATSSGGSGKAPPCRNGFLLLLLLFLLPPSSSLPLLYFLAVAWWKGEIPGIKFCEAATAGFVEAIGVRASGHAACIKASGEALMATKVWHEVSGSRGEIFLPRETI